MRVDLVGAQQTGHCRRNDFPAPLFLAADRNHHGKIARDDFRVKPGRLVLLVDEGNGRAARTALSQGQVFPGQRFRAIKDGQDQPGLVQLLPAAADALGLNGVIGLAQACGVKQVEPDIPQLHGLLHHVAGRARHRGNNGPVKPGQQVEQRGFARIGPPHNGTVHALPEHGPGIIVFYQAVQLLLYLSQHRVQVGVVQLGDILFREIHPGSQMGLQAGQGCLFRSDFPGQRAGEGRVGQRRSLFAVCRNNVHDGFRLGQAHFAVEERAAGILAGSCRGCACRDAGFHQPPGHRTAAVAGKLHHVLPGVAVGFPEKQGHALVKGVVSLHKGAKQGSVAFGFLHVLVRVGRVEHPCSHGIAFRPGQPHHRDAARPRCRGNGGNGRILHEVPSRSKISITVYCTTNHRKKKYKGAKKHSACGSFPCAVLILRCRAAAVRNVCFCPDTSAAPPF